MSDAAAPAVASPAPAVTPGVLGEIYGRYHLLEQIGKGGMAEIFRAVAGGAEGWSRQFVVKRIRPEKSGSREFIRMFCEEARLCALLHHPNIVQVYDFGQIDGSYFLAMEYLRGKDLSTVLRALRAGGGAFAPGVAAFIAHQTALGLHHAHTLVDGNGQPVRIVHRDVTPSNIMLLRSGGVKVLDFGIAKDVGQEEAETVETEAGQVKGKLAYLAPEQVRNLPLDGRADLFALGVVLWEMATGQRLFSAESEFQTMRNVLMQPVPAPSSVRPGVPAALDAVIMRALARERENRYGTAAEMATDLEAVVHSERFAAHAIPQLIQALFGDDRSVSAVTPTPSGLLSARRTGGSSDRSRGDSSDRQIPQGLGSVGLDGEVSMSVVLSEPPPVPELTAIARRRRRAGRGQVAVAVGVLAFAAAAVVSWRATRAPTPPPSPAIVAARPLPAAPLPAAPVRAPRQATAPPPAPAPSLGTARTIARTAPRARPAKRAAARVAPSALTLNPFR
ncbi:MAG TPA: serine/threonine-protein kinase [Polyangia bacterium]|nr:serine/threonine-protein kinase [Polyangia bacterium]